MSDPALADLLRQGDDAARRGETDLRTFWANLEPTEKRAIGGKEKLEEWKQVASKPERADA